MPHDPASVTCGLCHKPTTDPVRIKVYVSWGDEPSQPMLACPDCADTYGDGVEEQDRSNEPPPNENFFGTDPENWTD